MFMDFPRQNFMEIGDDVSSVIVVTSWELVKVVSKEVLFIKDSKVEVVESRRVIRRRESQGILEIENYVIVWSEEKELGAFVIKADGACCVKGEDGCDRECSVSRGRVHMVLGLEGRRPVNKAIAGELVYPPCMSLRMRDSVTLVVGSS